VLALSARQVHRLLRRYREYGAGGLTHRARGRRANNRIKDAVREHAIELVRTNYPDFGPTLAAEVLAAKHDLVVSRETLRILRAVRASAGLPLRREAEDRNRPAREPAGATAFVLQRPSWATRAGSGVGT